eukprot:m.295387 g.295387  ORF g.295387 m.295387 type:complete len:54 (-) comp20038_c0_seq1:848-1009(-)
MREPARGCPTSHTCLIATRTSTVVNTNANKVGIYDVRFMQGLTDPLDAVMPNR